MTRPIKAADLLELDPRLETVMLQGYPIPEQVIYQAAKNDYSETPIHHQNIPDANKCGEWIVETLLSNDKGHFGCYSSDTEVLTDKGWVFWPEVTEETVLAAYDTKTFKIHYEKPSAVQRWDYEGKMYHLRVYDPLGVHRVNILVSPDHRILYSNSLDLWGIKELTAEEFYSLDKENPRVTIPIPGGSITLIKNGYDEDWISYNGTIHCATVSTGALIVRRKGSQSFVCGNCLEHPQITLSVSGYVHSVMVQARTHRIATFDCLAGESFIDVLDGKITISELYEMYERGEKLPLIRTLNEDSRVFEYSEIGKVFKNNKKDICQVILEDGKRLKCSVDHRIFTDDGWKRLNDLHVNDKVICDNNISTTIVSIRLLRNDITYDIEVDGKYHNFVCDGVVVHNCQSQRYTGKRVLKVANGELDVEDVFYVRPVGFYTNRQGRKYDWTEEHRQHKLERIVEECMEYSNYYEQGMCEEHLRDYLPQAIRQNFVVSVNLRSLLHFMDLRAKMDAQLEIQALCLQMAPILQNWAPNVWNYYVEKRLHKAKLAP